MVVPADGLSFVSPETAEAVRAVASGIAAASGREPEEDDLGAYFNNEVADLFARIQARQAWAAHGQWLAENIGALAPDVAGRARRGEELSAAPLHQQQDDQRAWHAYTAALSERLPPGTVAVLPVLPDLAPLRTATDADVRAFRAGVFRFTTPAQPQRPAGAGDPGSASPERQAGRSRHPRAPWQRCPAHPAGERRQLTGGRAG